MPAKPLPQLRKPSASSAAAFVEAVNEQPPALEVVRAAPEATASAQPRKRAPEQKPARRRMTLYLSKETAKALRLQSFEKERDMSDIAEELLSKGLKHSR